MNILRSLFLILILFAVGCRGEDQDVQKIDQVLRIYVQDTLGRDRLVPDQDSAYFRVNMVDLDANVSNANVGVSTKKDSIRGYYIEYIAGGVRSLDSESESQKIYYSTLGFQIQKSSESVIERDTLTLKYKWTPQLFSLEQVDINGEVAFTRVEGEPNSIVIKN